MEFYTYIWRDASGVPFYVGKGKGKRSSNTTHRSKELKAIYAQGGCLVEIVDWFIHEAQAHAHEVELIERYGRREMGGLLVNKTDGGEGLSGASSETREKISSAMKVIWSDLNFRSKSIQSRVGLKRSAISRVKMSGAQTERFENAEAREKISGALKKHYESSDARAKISEATKGLSRSETTKAAMRVAQRMKPARVGFKGVSFHKRSGKWCAQITLADKRQYLGLFDDQESAAVAYNDAALSAFGPGNCYLNNIDRGAKNVAI